MAVPAEHCDIMDAVGSAADAMWEKHHAYIAGKVGSEAIHIQPVKMSHPPFPIFCQGLAPTAALSNGALLKIFDMLIPSLLASSM